MATDIDIQQLADLYKRAEAAKQEHLKEVISHAVGEAASAEAAMAEAAELQIRLQEPPMKDNLGGEAQLQIAIAEQLSGAEAAEAAVRIMENFASESLAQVAAKKP